MIRLSLEHINAKSPYEVKEAGGGYEFRTEGGILYRIRFLEENRNSRLKAITDEFDSTSAALTDKPQ